jgi:hypothetical protein
MTSESKSPIFSTNLVLPIRTILILLPVAFSKSGAPSRTSAAPLTGTPPSPTHPPPPHHRSPSALAPDTDGNYAAPKLDFVVTFGVAPGSRGKGGNSNLKGSDGPQVRPPVVFYYLSSRNKTFALTPCSHDISASRRPASPRPATRSPAARVLGEFDYGGARSMTTGDDGIALSARENGRAEGREKRNAITCVVSYILMYLFAVDAIVFCS